tara:strand:+ start:12 stop:419 length:408 start_codon:yes stop_codon:yes gene_type:complete
MKQRIAHVALIVKDYDEAVDFYTKKLEFTLVEDTPIEDEKRWVTIAPPGSNGCCLVLAKASNKEQESSIGNQAGGRVFLFLFTDNVNRDYHKMIEHKITFVRPPSDYAHGRVAVFKDLYGNLWDLIQPTEIKKST